MYINYSGLNIGGKSYFNTPVHTHVAHRDSRGRNVAYEHTEFTSGKEIRQAASNAGISLQYALREHVLPLCGLPHRRASNKLSGTPCGQEDPASATPDSYRTRSWSTAASEQDLLALHVRPLQKGL